MSSGSEFRFVAGYGLVRYAENLQSGDVVINKVPIVSRTHTGEIVSVLPRGARHFVLSGQLDCPTDVWMGVLAPETERLIWPLDSFWEHFDQTEEKHSYNHGDF